jgi:hypothetical protein
VPEAVGVRPEGAQRVGLVDLVGLRKTPGRGLAEQGRLELLDQRRGDVLVAGNAPPRLEFRAGLCRARISDPLPLDEHGVVEPFAGVRVEIGPCRIDKAAATLMHVEQLLPNRLPDDVCGVRGDRQPCGRNVLTRHVARSMTHRQSSACLIR